MKNKPKCSCYGGFDREVCNPDYYEEQIDTPRTDAAAIESDYITFLFVEASFAKKLEIELDQFRDAAKMVSDHIVDANKMVQELAASKAEVERLRKEIIFREDMDSVAQELWDEMKAEVERLQSQFKRAVEIAERFRQVKGLLYQCNCGWCQLLGDLKGEIK